MFCFSKTQKVCKIKNILVGGQPGENPPLLITSMFHNGDRILESRKERKFDKAKATEYVKRQEELSEQTGIPALAAIVASSVDEMKTYIDFYTSITDKPFGIDMWLQEPRLQAMRYVAEQGLADRVLYNSITPWDKDIPDQVQQLKEVGCKHIVVQVFDQENQTPAGRLSSFRQMMDLIGNDTFESVLVDTSVMNLPAMSFSGMACKMIKEGSGWPAGVASSNGTYMWKEAREMWGPDGFSAMNVAGQASAVLLWSDFLFSGPIVNIPKLIPATVATTLLLSTLVYQQTGKLSGNPNHPIYKFFNEFAQKLNQPIS